MKKILLIATIALSLGTANAQTVKYGLKGGLNLASLRNSADTNDDDNSVPLIAYHAGGFAEINLGDGLIVQPELLYTIVGSASKSTIAKIETKTKSEVSYLTVPVMFKYYFKEKYALEAGPQVGYLLGVKQTANGKDITPKNAKKRTSSIDLGINVGVTYSLTDNLSLGARYCYGLWDTYAERHLLDENRSYNNALQISLGFSF